MGPHDEPQAQLRGYLRTLRHHKWLILAVTALSVAAALVLSSMQTPRYVATAKVLVKGRGQDVFTTPGQRAPDPVTAVETEIEVLRSPPIRDAVSQAIGEAPPVSVAAVQSTNIVELAVASSDPEKAARAANAYATAYTEFRRKQAVDNLLAATEQIQAKINEIKGRIDELDRQVNEAPLPLRQGVQSTVTAERNTLIEQQGAFKQRIAQAQLDTALATGQAEIVKSAVVPTTPVSPRPKRNAVIALVVGLGVGIALSFLIDHLDDSIRSKDDLDRVAGGLPAVGVIPAVAGWKTKADARVVSIEDPKSPTTEAFRTLRTSLQFLTLGQDLRTLQVTSPGMGEGKTTIVANLGVALAGTGVRVIIVDCDLRKPRLHKFFNVDNSVGLTSVLLGKAPLTAALRKVPGQPNLSVLPSGEPPPNPAELLSSPRTLEVITAFQSYADMVVIDSPPVLPVTDALVLSSRVDGTLIVCRGGITNRRELGRALELLRQVDAPLLGTIFNAVSASSEGSYYYYQYYRYDQAPEKAKRFGIRPRNGKVDHGSAPAEPDAASR